MDEASKFVLFVLCCGGGYALLFGALWIYLGHLGRGHVILKGDIVLPVNAADDEDEDGEIIGREDDMNVPCSMEWFLFNPSASDHICNIYHSDTQAGQEEDGY